MSYDPAISLLGIYLEKTIIQKDTCTPMFVAAIFTTAKTQKQPKCPLAGVPSSREELPHIQGQELWLRFTGLAIRRKPRSRSEKSQ